MADPLTNTSEPTVRIVIGSSEDAESGSGETSNRRRQRSRGRRTTASRVARAVMRSKVTRKLTQQMVAGIKTARAAALGSTAVAATGLSSAARVAGGGPVGWVLAAVGVMSLAAVRGLSGRSFEGISLEAEKLLLGDSPDEALAMHEARNIAAGHDHALSAVATQRDGYASFHQIVQMQRKVSLLRIRGEREIRRSIDVDGVWDMLALRLWAAMRNAFATRSMEMLWLAAVKMIAARLENPATAWTKAGIKAGIRIGRYIAGAR